MQPPSPCLYRRSIPLLVSWRFVQQHLGGLHPGRQRRLCRRLPRHHRRVADGELAAQHGAAADRGVPRGDATGMPRGMGKTMEKSMENEDWSGKHGGFYAKMGGFGDFSSSEIWDLTNQKPVISLAIWRVSPGMMVICPSRDIEFQSCRLYGWHFSQKYIASEWWWDLEPKSFTKLARKSLDQQKPMMDPWCCFFYGNMDPINIPPMSVYIPAPWIRHGKWMENDGIQDLVLVFTNVYLKSLLWNPHEMFRMVPPNDVCCFINL